MGFLGRRRGCALDICAVDLGGAARHKRKKMQKKCEEQHVGGWIPWCGVLYRKVRLMTLTHLGLMRVTQSGARGINMDRIGIFQSERQTARRGGRVGVVSAAQLCLRLGEQVLPIIGTVSELSALRQAHTVLLSLAQCGGQFRRVVRYKPGPRCPKPRLQPNKLGIKHQQQIT